MDHLYCYDFTMLMYNTALILGFALSLPKTVFQLVKYGKGKKSLTSKLGIANFSLPIKRGKRILIHSVSVGETKAVIPLAEILNKEGIEIVISNGTETGHAEALKSIPFAKAHLFLPFDFPFAVKRFIDKIDPDFVLISETDLWYNFLKTVNQRKIKTALINGKISERSKKRFLLFKNYSRKLFSLIDHFFVQSSHYKNRFLELNIPEEKITVTGNLKFQIPQNILSDTSKAKLKDSLKIKPEDRVIVFGSTHPDEEEIFIELLSQIKGVKGVIVPRHPERFDAVEKLLEKSNASYCRLSKGVEEGYSILLIDRMGMLTDLYAIADVAVVAGSFTNKVGGHNILEPLFANAPLVFGPHLFNQPELEEIVLSHQAGIQTDKSGLREVIERILNDPREKNRLEKNKNQLFDGIQKAVLPICKYLQLQVNRDVC